MLTTILSTIVLAQPALSISKLRTLQGTHVIALAPMPGGSKFVASMEDATVRIIDAKSGATVMMLKGHPQPAYGVAVNPAGTIIASGDETARIWLWDAKTGKKLKEFNRNNGHQRGIQSLSFSKDGTMVASTGKDDVIILWSVAKGNPVLKLLGKGANFYGGVFNPAGGSLVTATIGEGARVYKVNSSQPAYALTGHDGQGALDVSVNKVGSIAVTAGKDSKGNVWSLVTRKKMGSLAGHTDFLIHTAFAPSGRFVATSSSDRTVKVWSLANFSTVATLDGQSFIGSPICFTSDGRYLISSTDADAIQISTVNPPQGTGVNPITGPRPKLTKTTVKVNKPLGNKKGGG